ncbi:MAG TPA: CPBP family intramembrane glutamic endopeptidase, partial [Rhizomicrobium sp.]|nr:CPBP family intramembrane glutamic endopeptidase [Rhizomicrobium sp.]
KLILWFLIPLTVLLVQWRGDFAGSLRAAGFRSFSTKMFLPGLAALLAEGGTLIAYGARLPTGFDFGPLALSALVAPFAEELLFRGYLVNELAASGLSTARAFVMGGLLFGLAHLGNVLHQPPASMLAEVGITAAGGMLFGWTLLRFEGSLWAAFAFHAGLNLPWDAFGVDQTAIGGMTGNIARAAGVVAGIVAVRLLTRRRART